MLAAIVFFVFVLYLTVFIIKRHERESKAHPLPPAFPGKIPVFGHLFLLGGDNASIQVKTVKITNFCLEQGGIVYVKLDTIYYHITDPEDALIVANTCLDKTYSYDYLSNWIGYGMIISKAHIWKRHRKHFHPVFSPALMFGFLGIFNQQGKKLVSNLEAHCGKGLSDILPTIADVILETSSLSVFGRVRKNDAFQNYKDALDRIGYLALHRFKTFYLHSDFMYSLLGYQKIVDGLLKTLKEMSIEVLDEEKAKMKNEKDNADSDVTFRTFGELIVRNGVNGGLPDEEIVHEIDTAIAASFDTSTNQLLYTLCYLGSHPEVQEKLYEEVIEVVGPDGDIDKEILTRLVYTEAVIKEVLRLQPTTPASSRNIPHDVKLKNYTLRAGSECVILHSGINRHPAWKDPNVFRPERWFDKENLPPPIYFASFGMGKRACAGRSYAMLSLKTNLAYVIRAFKLKADYTKLVNSYEVTLKPIAGHEVALEKRN